MSTLMKKVAGMKNIPLFFLAIFTVMFTINMVHGKFKKKTTFDWVYEGMSFDPTSIVTPENYVKYSGSLVEHCSQLSLICGIIAPEDDLNPGRPLISPQLANRVQNSQTDHGDVFLLPVNPIR